jgi:hypothetical protein
MRIEPRDVELHSGVAQLSIHVVPMDGFSAAVAGMLLIRIRLPKTQRRSPAICKQRSRPVPARLGAGCDFVLVLVLDTVKSAR